MKYKKITRKTWDSTKHIPVCPDKGAFEISYLDTTYFVVDGMLHRTDGPAVILDNGIQKYYQNDRLHREDGPAIVWPSGSQYYYQNGKKHRTDGPAAICSDGSHYYYLFGKEYKKEDWEPLAIQLSLKEQIL